MSAPANPGLALGGGLPWERLRARARLLPGLHHPRFPPGQASCRVCRGPAGAGYLRCYQCARHESAGPGLLADVVVPISYAVRGAAFTSDLWRYKSPWATDAAVRTSLLSLLLVFLRDHGECVWRAGGMPVPDRLAVVPSGYGRPDVHPLLRMVAPHVRLPLARLLVRPGEQGRDLNPDRFAAAAVPGAHVLLIDDAWVSGASIQSAAAALKLAGAATVAAVVLGRYVDPGPEYPAHDPAICAICGK